MREIKNIANILTLLRIAGAVSLLFMRPLSEVFYLVYILCGVSDILDGYFARRTKAESSFGANLDSTADLVLVIVVLILLIPQLSIEAWMICWIAAIALIRLISLAIGFIKYRKPAFLHTYANKITGLALFCFPILLEIFELQITAVLLCLTASLAAVEELLINVKQRSLDRNVKAIFIRKG